MNSSLVYSVGKTVSTALKNTNESLSSNEPPELQFLREKCKDENYVTSHSACQGIVKLVEAGIVSIPKALSILIALLPSVKIHGSVISAVGELMVLDLKMRLQAGQEYKNPFNLHSPQHPLLTILKRNPDCWDEIVNQISSICNHQDDVVKCFSSELLKPVALYMMCDPITTAEAPPVYLQPLWNILLSLDSKRLALECLPLLQVKSFANQSLLIQLAALPAFEGLSRDELALSLANVAYILASSGRNPQPALVALGALIKNCSIFLGSCLVIIFSHAISVAAPNHLPPLLSRCQLIIGQGKCCPFAGRMFAASVLPFLACPSPLIAEPLHTIQSILGDLKSSQVHPEPAALNSHSLPLAHLAIRSYILGADWNSQSLLKWLNVVKMAPQKFQLENYLVLGAFLVSTENSTPALPVCLDILVELARNNVQIVASVLTWLLSRLSQEKRPECQLALLKALPRLGKQKENVSLIINTLESLRSEPALMPLVLNLYLTMWKLEPRVFPYLHKLLLVEAIGKPDLQNYWDITRAHTIKEICLARPSQHGKDLVGILSGILNRCTGESGATACSLALEAIAALCSATVIDVASTWKVLAPRLAPDMRPAVVKNLCAVLGLMSEVPSNHPEQSKLWTDVQTRLWYYSACGLSTEVSIAAFKALSRFALEEFYLAVVPAVFKKNLPYPPEFTKSATDSSKTPEEVLNFIPGVCWPQMLAVLPTSTTLVAKLLRDEISSLRGALQQMPGKAEPDLPRLNIYSIFLGLLSCLRKAAADEPVVSNILKVLAEPMPKQFPPCNWSFLENLARQRVDLLVPCLKVAAKQAHVSPTALAVTESLLKEASTMNLEIQDIVETFSILEMLGKTVEPTALRNFVEAHVRSAIEFGLANEAHLETLHSIFRHIKSTLLNDSVLEINQKLLALTLDDLMSEISWKDEKVFLPYNECVSQMHSKFLNEMTSPTAWSEVHPQKLENAIVIRTWIAANSEENALNWVNECIEACSTKPKEHEFLFQHLVPALVHNRKSAEVTGEWLLQLMSQTQASLLSGEMNDRSLYLFDVWSVVVLTLSGHLAHGDVVKSRQVRLDLLPQATLSLVHNSDLKQFGQQVIEWLHGAIQSGNLPDNVSSTCTKSLQTLRQEDCMKRPGVWTKIDMDKNLQWGSQAEARWSIQMPQPMEMDAEPVADETDVHMRDLSSEIYIPGLFDTTEPSSKTASLVNAAGASEDQARPKEGHFKREGNVWKRVSA